jgi:hypothetical protein
VQAKGLGDGGQEQIGLAEGCQADRDCAMGEDAGEAASAKIAAKIEGKTVDSCW